MNSGTPITIYPIVHKTWFLVYPEPPSESIYPINGRSGHLYGYATYDPERGKFCLKMTDEEFQAAKGDIFSAQRRWYYPVPEVEISLEWPATQEDEPATPVQEAPALENTQAHTTQVDPFAALESLGIQGEDISEAEVVSDNSEGTVKPRRGRRKAGE